MGEERGLEDWNSHDAGSGHVKTSNGLGLVQHVLDGLLCQGVEAQVNLFDVDKDVGVRGNAGDQVVGYHLELKIENSHFSF